ncbi:hypothetical protein [Streptomyces sp. NBC_00996]|uniref:hypothetical protein n=1 Tax=Streptomyces sp. NBC_00996 TaxID=2903710 RepID=UPI0038662916|nr:hypothetical protein OG390_38585 [Streptomyces sp. NBC_00996]
MVDLARRVAEGIDPSRRLSKSMIASGHQSYDRGDLLALTFGTPQEEAAWICDPIEWMIGLPFTDRADAPPRGLAYSDFAVLFSSVSGDADPLVTEMRARGIRYIIKGLSRLFQMPEVQAAKTGFDDIAETVDGDAVVTAWTGARLGLHEEALKHGVKILDEARGWAEGMPWDTYTIQGTYQRFRIRPARRRHHRHRPPGQGHAVAGAVQHRHRRLRAHPLPQQPARPVRHLRHLGEVGVREEHLKAEVGPERVRALYARNRFPSKWQGRLGVFHIVLEAAVNDADRYRGSEDDERRLFYLAAIRARKYLALPFSPGGQALPVGVAVLRRGDPQHLRPDPGGRQARRVHAEPAALHPPGRDARHRLKLQRAEVPVRMPVPVQAAVPVRLRLAVAEGTRIRQVAP